MVLSILLAGVVKGAEYGVDVVRWEIRDNPFCMCGCGLNCCVIIWKERMTVSLYLISLMCFVCLILCVCVW